MDRISIATLAASKSYTDASVAGGGAIKGKNCVITSIAEITGGHRVTFQWTLDNGTVQTGTMDVMDGADGQKGETGLGIKSASIVNSHLILILDDDTPIDAGEVSGFDTDMSHITDIDLSNLADGQILKYNGTTRKWENASAGTVDTNLIDLNDVDVENLEDGQIIVWDATAGRWKNADNAPSITIDNTPTQGSTNAVSSGGVYSALDNKVDKVSGKGLSANDYTNTDKAIVDGVTAALAEKADVSDVPTKTSDLTNDSGFIANTVNNLVNYYLKSETYTKSEVDAIVGAISTLHFEAVSVLPSENIQTNVIYLVPKSTPQTDNVKDEYINLDGTSYGWELIGSTEIDLSNYVTTTALNTALADYVTSTGLATILADYATTSAMNTALAGKADNATTLAGYGITDAYTKSAVDTALAGKVDAVSGKGLSSNDYTNTDKAIVDGVTSALAGKADTSDIPTATSDLTNDSGFITSSDLTNYVQKSQTAGLLKNDGTVDTNSYAQTSQLPSVATSQTAGLVKPDGSTTTVDANGVISATGGGSGDSISKVLYTVSSGSWSSSVNADGYYTYSFTLNPTLDTTIAPTVTIAGATITTQPTDANKTQYGYVERCLLNGSTLTLYAKTKPSANFYVYVEGVAGSGSGSIVGNVIQPNGAVNPYQLSTSEAVFTGRYWTNGKRIMQRVFSFNVWASETHDDIIYMHSWDKTMFSSINYMGNHIRLISIEYQNAQYVYDVTKSEAVKIGSLYVDTNTGNLVFQIYVPSSWLNKPITLFVEYSER